MDDKAKEFEENVKNFLLWTVNELNVRPTEFPLIAFVEAVNEAIDAAIEDKVEGDPRQFYNAIVKKHKDKHLKLN